MTAATRAWVILAMAAVVWGVAVSARSQVVSTPIVPGFDFNPHAPSAGQTVSFIDRSGGPVISIAWDFGDPASGTNNSSTNYNPTHIYFSPGSFTVTQTVSGPARTPPLTKTISVSPTGAAPTAGFDLLPNVATVDQVIRLQDKSLGAPTSWSWDFGDETTGTGESQEHRYGTPNTYRITLTVSNAFGSDSISQSAVVTPSGTQTNAEFPIPTTSASRPQGITTGPDGALWFTVSFAISSGIGRLDPGRIGVGVAEVPLRMAGGSQLEDLPDAGDLRVFPLVNDDGQPLYIAAGSDGNLWFTEFTGNSVGRITPAGSITKWRLPPDPLQPLRKHPAGIVKGPDGNMWFVEYAGNKVGRITPTGDITEFPIPTANSHPSEITVGPDGNLWFTESSGNKIGRITPTGSISEFPLPVNANPFGIVAGPDGNLWFTEGNSKIGKMTTAGAVTEFPLPGTRGYPGSIIVGPDAALWFTFEMSVGRITTSGTITESHLGRFVHGIAVGSDGNLWVTADGALAKLSPTVTVLSLVPSPPDSSFPLAMTVGPDRNIWFTEYYGDKVAMATPQGTVTEFSVPGSGPFGIASGPDGAVWFCELDAGKIGRITVEGVITEYVLPTPYAFPVSVPAFITAGPDGHLWFTELTVEMTGVRPKIGRISPAGVLAEFPLPEGSFPSGITAGPDGNLWITDADRNLILRMSTSGFLTEFAVPTSSSSPAHITAGPDGNLWFTETGTNQIGRIDPQGNIREFTLLQGDSIPSGITTAKDGNLWFTLPFAGRIGRITPAGQVTEFPALTPNSGPFPIAQGADGNLWYGEITANNIARFGIGSCSGDSYALCLNGGRFRVQAKWRVPSQGTSGFATAAPLTSDTGYFWFFSANNIELVIKVVDGRAFNGNFWVFYGALSDVEYSITVTDTATGIIKTYSNSSGNLASVADTAAFAASSSGPSGAVPSGATGATIAARPRPSREGPRTSSPLVCTAGPTTLCLNAARFKVEVGWRAPALGTSGAGMAVPLTTDTGEFWFFSSNNIELVVKVVDGRAFNGKYWVFYGALSDVEYTITVTDTVTGTVKTYFNTSGNLASVADTTAF